MKIRSGFVSNSSSSSFVILLDKSVTNSIDTIEELNAVFLNKYDYKDGDDNRFRKEMYEKYKEYLGRGYHLYIDEMEWGEGTDTFSEIINNLGYEIIWEDQ